MKLPHLALAAALAGGTFAAQAQTTQQLAVAQWAAACAQCHGTHGNAVAGSAVLPLAGMPKATMVASLQAFKAGQRPATIMHQLAKGYSDQQIEQIAEYFAAQPRR